MPHQIHCPSCGKVITPINERISTRGRLLPRKGLVAWIIEVSLGGIGTLVGILLFIFFRLTITGFIGLGLLWLGVVVSSIVSLRSIRVSKLKGYRNRCPECGYSWIEQMGAMRDPVDLEAYFTDAEELRKTFATYTSSPSLSRRLIIIHGMGGVGKSSVLRMFRMHCRNTELPFGFASGDEVKNEIDILSNWATGLQAEDIELPAFSELLAQYQSIQKKVEQKAQEKTSTKVSKTVANVLVQAAASAVPVIGGPLSVISGAGVDMMMDWLHNFLSKEQIDLLLDPTKNLTAKFLNDLEQVASDLQHTHPERHIVLFIDTFEALTSISNWVCNLAQGLNPHVLLVIAGRAVPTWNRQWPGWMSQAYIEEIKPMTEQDMRTLIKKYYATQRGGQPDPEQVEAIIHFARGLPLAVTSAIQLWVQYGVEDFHMVEPQVIADLTNHLTAGVSEQMRPVLKAAATLRWFNKELLSVVLGEPVPDATYNELRWFPFVRSRVEGLTLHDLIRDLLSNSIRSDEPDLYCEMHQRASDYFKTRLEMGKGRDTLTSGQERLYHTICAHEEEGIKLFQTMAEELVNYSLFSQLRTLLNDVSNYPFKIENSRLWIKYYDARLADLEGRFLDAEKIYQVIGENKKAEIKLQAYALCDWGSILRWPREGQPADVEKAARVIESGLDLYPSDPKQIIALTELSEAYTRLDRWDKAFEVLTKAKALCVKNADYYGVAFICSRQKVLYLAYGDWYAGFAAREDGLTALSHIAEQAYLKSLILGNFAFSWVLIGQYAKGEKDVRTALSLQKQIGANWLVKRSSRDLASLLAMQGKYAEADSIFAEGLAVEKGRAEDQVTGLGIHWALWGATFLRRRDLDKAKEYLERSMKVFEGVNQWDSPYYLYPLGELHELLLNWKQAEIYYRQCYDLHWGGLTYYEIGSLTRLVRVVYVQERYNEVPALLKEAQTRLQPHDFNDLQAELHLLQGHMAWEGHISSLEQGIDRAMQQYQQAIIYALRYNRFLLDELLSGNPQGSALQPLIPYCLTRGIKGLQVLTDLRNWWQTSTNTLANSVAKSVSLLPEGIPLLEAERMARREELSDGSLQRTVLEHLDQVLAPSTK